MQCDCKYLSPVLLHFIEVGIKDLAYPENRQRLEEELKALGRDCGYEKVGQRWIQFPKRQAALDKLELIEDDIIHEHSDGDLTVNSEKFLIFKR